MKIRFWTMNSFYCWSNAKFVRWRFDLMFFTNATSHTPEVHVSFCIRWHLQKWVVVSQLGIFGHSDFHYVMWSNLDMERIFFFSKFSLVFHGYAVPLLMLWWLCAECFDDFICFGPLYFACDFADKFQFHFVDTNTRRRFLKRHAGLVKNRYQQLSISAIVNSSSC